MVAITCKKNNEIFHEVKSFNDKAKSFDGEDSVFYQASKSLPVSFAVMSYFLVQHFQGQNISTHIGSCGEKFSLWRTILIVIICLIITVVLGILI